MPRVRRKGSAATRAHSPDLHGATEIIMGARANLNYELGDPLMYLPFLSRHDKYVPVVALEGWGQLHYVPTGVKVGRLWEYRLEELR